MRTSNSKRGFVRPSVCWSVRPSVRRSVSTSQKVGKGAYPPLPTRLQLVLAVYPALFDRTQSKRWMRLYNSSLAVMPLQAEYSLKLKIISLFFSFFTEHSPIVECDIFLRQFVIGSDGVTSRTFSGTKTSLDSDNSHGSSVTTERSLNGRRL